MNPNIKSLWFLLIPCLLMGACSSESDSLFVDKKPEQTGVMFENHLVSTPAFNILNYLYFYDGGGVSIGDINNDGRPDIYFTANQGSNKLYLNQGNWNFKDITETAGVAGSADWTTGTTMADINGDGLLDIYVSAVNYLNQQGKNQLFINNGDSTFSEQAARYGLAVASYSKQATFFDYDNDGDLDLYLLNHAVHTEESFTYARSRNVYNQKAGDKLFRNDGRTFTEVSNKAGIYSSTLGYGLAATASDINQDGYTDLYVSNDFHENDYLYLNNGDGTFREVLQQAMGHTSRASMGNDIADFNNDGRPDIFVLDMLPDDEKRRKTSVSGEPYAAYQRQREFGYHPQLIRNTLQLNLGAPRDSLPVFAEIGQLSGVAATDWSWAALFFDMNNNGRKDLFISNGMYRRPNDLDYLALAQTPNAQRALQQPMNDTTMALITKMPHVKIPNAGFLNQGNLRFSGSSRSLGFSQPTYSNGAAYGDLDGDGDWDLVVNNVNDAAQLFENTARADSSSNYLKLRLRGSDANTYGIGATATIYSAGGQQLFELMPTRGFQSSVEAIILAGVGATNTIDSLTVRWPGGAVETRVDVDVNQTLELQQQQVQKRGRSKSSRNTGSPLMVDVTLESGVSFIHRENNAVDFDRQLLAPEMLSHEGPALAVGDVNADGLDDFFVGGAQGQAGQLYVQQASGQFNERSSNPFKTDAQYEDVAATFFDANGNGHLDLYVGSGGNAHPPQDPMYTDRLYLNDGQGQFVRASRLLPSMAGNTSVVAAADIDNDGDHDLFVGSRSVPAQYGASPQSYILINDGSGHFTNKTASMAPKVGRAGMITDASWLNLNGDGYPELLISGDWMPLMLFSNINGKLQNATDAAGLDSTNGFWNSITVGDWNGDGAIDFMAGNRGLNTAYEASPRKPLTMYLIDSEKNARAEPIIARTVNGTAYPAASRDEVLAVFPELRSTFKTYDDFAGQSIQQLFGDALDDALIKKVYQLETSYFQNNGRGQFSRHPLPVETQFAPVMDIAVGNYDAELGLEALTAGNFYPIKPSMGGQADASYGWMIDQDKNERFDMISFKKSGYAIRGDARSIKTVAGANGSRFIIVARNSGPLSVFKLTEPTR